MARARIIQNSFTAGEISPLLLGRTDFEKYDNAAKQLENVIPLKYGGVLGAPGSRHVKEVKDSTKKTRAIDFEFNVEQAYIIEMGDLYFRFYKDGGRIEETGQAVEGAIDNGAGLVEITITGHGYSNGDWIHINGIVGTTEANAEQWQISGVTANTFDLDGSSFLNVYVSGGTASLIVQITTPYLEAELFDIKFEQDADTMWLVHPNHQTRKLTRTSDTAWTLTLYAPTANPFTGANLFPSAIAFWQERLWFANTNTNPRRILSTKSGDFEDMTTGIGDDDALILDPASGEQNLIRWLSPAKVLLYGTAGDENQVRAAQIGAAITPSDSTSIPETNHGSRNVQPVRANNATLFVQRSGRKIRELLFNFDINGYQAREISQLAEHLLPKGKSITQMAYEKEPNSIIWAVRSDGILLSLTYERPEDVFAWATRRTTDSNSDSKFESVATIPHPDGDRDQTWVIVNRTINGITKRYVEYFDDTLFLDSALSYSGASVTTLTGLEHLEGELVGVIGNGAIQPNKRVSAGQITVDPAVTSADVGLLYTPTVVTLPPEFNSGAGTIQGSRQRFSKLIMRLENTVKEGVTINGDFASGRAPTIPMGSPPTPVSEDVNITPEDSWEDSSEVTIKQTIPAEFQLLSLIGTIEATEQ